MRVFVYLVVFLSVGGGVLALTEGFGLDEGVAHVVAAVCFGGAAFLFFVLIDSAQLNITEALNRK